VAAARPVLVTGGAGFIGSTLVDRMIAEGRRVIAVDDLSSGSLANLAAAREARGSFEFVRLDVGSPHLDALVARHEPEVVFHLAAQVDVRRSVEDPRHDATQNILATLNVLEAARRHGVAKVVFASSGGTIYGEPSLDELPLRESHPGHPTSPYGASKRAAEEYLHVYEALYGLRWTSLALANVYGPRQDLHGEAGVVAIFTQRMRSGQPVVIYGDGEQSRDLVYVDDVVHAFALAATRGDGQRFNIGTGTRTSVNDLFDVVAAALGHDDAAVHAPERTGELRHSALDASHARALLGWEAWTPLAEGIAMTVRALAARA